MIRINHLVINVYDGLLLKDSSDVTVYTKPRHIGESSKYKNFG
jgi:hypothetical protein